MVWNELTKFLKLPINAKPSAPIKIAIAFEVKIPAIILVNKETVCKDVTLTKTFLFM